VLRGATRLLAENRAVRFIVEMHPYAWSSAGYDEKNFREFCVEHCLQIKPLSGQENVFSEYGQVLISSDA
jgi:hypothetical protein